MSLDYFDSLLNFFLKNLLTCFLGTIYSFNLSFETGIVPAKLKVSRTVPIYKAGSPENLTNYWPKSCLSVISKIIEKIVCKRFYNYLTENNLLYNLQFAFQSGKSTVHPLIPLVNYIADAFNKNEYVVAVFLDLAKAFDLVSHSILLKKF